jgi:alpha-galactosidase
MQGLTYGLSFWIPYYGGGNVACEAGYYGEGTTPVDPYAFWSCCYPAINCAVDVRAKDIDYDALRDLLRMRDIVVKFFCGDYYPLTAYSQEGNVWMAWQFHRPELGEGVVQAFRHKDSPFFGRELKLRGLLADATYELIEFDNPERPRMPGRELMEQGLPVTIEEGPGAAVIVYRRVE